MPTGEPLNGIGEIDFRVEAVQSCVLDLGVGRGGTLAALIGPGEQEVLAADGNHEVILPISGMRSLSAIDGTHWTDELIVSRAVV